ncbi:MAG TPA: hypothetical protein VG797_00960, partial [Phycisphaerales bacterium]|nr:hypothetical protein [Phycisphaerales bacterium]
RLLGRLQDEMAISDAYLEISNIFNAIDDVTDKQILTLWLNDMTPARIGECLGMPRKTVNWRWSRIRDTLKGALGA